MIFLILDDEQNFFDIEYPSKPDDPVIKILYFFFIKI